MGSGERQPTSHERRSSAPWDESYRGEEPAPWDIGRPQPAIARLAAAGGFGGSVLDAGCGSGEHALHLAALGLPVLGFDVAETAIAMARQKAAARRLEADFAVADALELNLDRSFDTVLDVGLFHTFESDERRRYLASLAAVTEPGATLHVLCFRDAGRDSGPHPVTDGELREAFGPGSGWELGAVGEDVIETTFAADGIPAWLATVGRS